MVAAFARAGVLPASLSLGDLRACLFWEQRRGRYSDEVAVEGKQRDYLLALLGAIRASVAPRRNG